MKRLLTTVMIVLVYNVIAWTQFVGIGTETPSALLDVAGDARVHGLTIGQGASLGTENTAIGFMCLPLNISGFRNTAVGQNAMNNNTLGNFNLANGGFALHHNISGSYNSAVGSNAMYENTTGGDNTGLGFAALSSNTMGNANTALGFGAMFFSTTGGNNTGVGHSALINNTTGNYNVALGRLAGYTNTTGSQNIFIGQNASAAVGNLENATAIGSQAWVAASNSIVLGSIIDVNGATANTNVGIGTTTPGARLDVAADARINGLTVGQGAFIGSENTAVGFKCLFLNVGGIKNVAIGQNSMENNTHGSYNVANGAFALHDNITGSFNSAFGAEALYFNHGEENTAIGYGALYLNTMGGFNTALGVNAMYQNTTGENNTGVGYQALSQNTTGSYNIALGYQAGFSNLTGSKNIFIGRNAKPSVGNLENATALGNQAFVEASNSMVLGSIDGMNGATVNTNVGIGTTTPAARLDVAADILINGHTAGRGAGNVDVNTVFGNGCLQVNTTGTRNVGIGFSSLYFNETGSYNVTSGAFSLRNNISGSFNSAFGDDALTANTMGEANTGIGASALYSNSTGADNTAVGRNAGTNNITGNGNTLIGKSANVGGGDLQNATAIGYRALVGSSNSLILGSVAGENGASENTSVGIGTTTPTASLDVVGTINATAWKTTSMNVNGYAEMGGVLLQWGMASYTSNSAQTITFPTVFNNVYSVTATVDADIGEGSGVNVPVKVQNIGNNTFQIAGMFEFSDDMTSKVRWMAVGN